MKFTEAQLEQAFIELLGQEDIPHVLGGSISRSEDEVLIKADLKAFLLNQYKAEKLTEVEADQIIRRLEILSASDLYESNKAIMKMVSDGFMLKREDRSQKDIWVYLIDFSKQNNNNYKIVNQLEITGYHKRIPDGILYINGLPLVVFEFKTAINENVSIHDAYVQITTRYKRDIPELFKYNAFCVISDGVNSKAGSFFAPYEFYYAWRAESDRHFFEGKQVDGFNSMESMIKGMFNQNNLRDIIRNFIFIPDSSKKDEKIVCRYPQYYATRKLYENILVHQKPKGDGKGGTYFGTTGCGKSFTMLFLTRLLMKSKEMASPTIIIITDRTDLDDQLSGQFTNAKGFIGDNVVQTVTSRTDLRAQLKGRNSGGVFLTTIHKFNEDTELLTERTNVVCISDEAHRSQINLDQKVTVTEEGVKKSYGFAKHLHDSLPNATYVGFTGTPVDATLDVFGDIVDSYTMTESVKDEITVRIVYEGRAAKMSINNSALKEIEEYYNQVAADGASEYHIEKSKTESSNMNMVLGDPDRLEAIAKDFVKHYETRIKEGSTVKGKAMFVCSSRPIAYAFYKQVIKLLGQRSSSSANYADYADYAEAFTKNYGLPEEWHKGNLPHRNKVDLIQFITFRLGDSIPKKALEELEASLKNIKDEKTRIQKQKTLEKYLDNGYGCCALAKKEMAQVMLDALLHHDGDKYDLLAWSIMPNHVHVMIKTKDELPKIIQSWKSFTGKWAIKHNKKYKLNLPDKADRFWMPEYWDRFIRDANHFNATVSYILNNPKKAGLPKDHLAYIYTGHAITERSKQELQPAQVKMIMTRGQDDPAELYNLLGDKADRKELDRQFKNEKSNFKIAIVVDMWLTGFDVPFLDTMYIDKPIQRHNLIQTISRVNRKFAGKGKGLIVDYIGIKKEMNLALAMYNKVDGQNFEDIDQSILVVKNHLDLLDRFFHGFNTDDYFKGKSLVQLHCLNRASEFVLETEQKKKRFMDMVKRLKSAYDICCGSEELSQSQKDYIHFYLAIRSIVYKLTKGDAPDTAQMNAYVRDKVAAALQSDGIEEIIKLGDEQNKEQDIFDLDYLANIDKIKLPNTKIQLLQKLLAKAIGEMKKVNKIQGVEFSKKMKAVVDRYNERKDNVYSGEEFEAIAGELTRLIMELKDEFKAGDDLGIDFEEKAFFDILKTLAEKYDFSYPKERLLFLAKHVKQIVDDKAKYTDWSERSDIKAELKVDLIILLGENDYPPVDRDEVYKEIFEQAENFKKHR
ncbi:hypothetical protein DNU06_10105 [Putridiphycobacter roseus]|uniref:Type I restriction enzyme endonuclease subunit n=1 Tax=Putridiphycobacter roseus TaxID=2219161 RepID=A0A2W1MYX4_9FLAO|nr:HsdR family type I site-specific deoxyribonuclease [Putridiphycobacter roseus]PZE17087.1 hypothetical protein DNU06_10105 [Putridiphycobacter roseus]